jgi:hypothetical protein
MKFFKIEAQGDKVFIKAQDEAAAKEVLTENIGPIPSSLLTVTEITEGDLPDGDEWLSEED